MVKDDSWHLAPGQLDSYAQFRLDYAGQASVEAHMTSCAQCRTLAVGVAPAPLLCRAWEGVSLEVAAPRQPFLLRGLQRLGLPEVDAVALHASASLHLPLVLAVLGALSFAAAGTAFAGGDLSLYLLVAPMVPALAVVAAYDTTDPLREMAGPTPYSKLRLALLRTLVAVTLSLPPAVLVGLTVPGVGALAVGWLLPTLAVTSLALALLTWWRARVVGPAVTGAWLSLVLALRAQETVSSVLLPAAQLAFAGAACLCALVFTVRLYRGHSAGGFA